MNAKGVAALSIRWPDDYSTSHRLWRGLVQEHLCLSADSWSSPTSPPPEDSPPEDVAIFSALALLWPGGDCPYTFLAEALDSPTPNLASTSPSLPSPPSEDSHSWGLVLLSLEGAMHRAFFLWQQRDQCSESRQLFVTLRALLLLALNSQLLPVLESSLQLLHHIPSPGSSSWLTERAVCSPLPSRFVTETLAILPEQGTESQEGRYLIRILLLVYFLSLPPHHLTQSEDLYVAFDSQPQRLSDWEYELFIRSYLEHCAATIAAPPSPPPRLSITTLLEPPLVRASTVDLLRLKEFTQLCGAIQRLLFPLSSSPRAHGEALDPSFGHFYSLLLRHQRLLSSTPLLSSFDFADTLESSRAALWPQEVYTARDFVLS
jgi:hypothetical protein